MRLLLIHHVYTGLNQPGGTRHAELFRGLAQRGHSVTVIAGGRNYLDGRRVIDEQVPADGSTSSVQILRVPERGGTRERPAARAASQLAFAVRAFAAARRIENIDVVVGTSPPVLQGVSAFAAARCLGVPYVFEVRDLWLSYAREAVLMQRRRSLRGIGRLGVGFLDRAEGQVLSRADAILCNSPGHIAPLHRRGISLERLHLVPNSVDLEAIVPQRASPARRASIGLSPDDFVVLYAGAHGYLNDLDTLLSAAGSLRDVPRMKVVLMGSGPQKARLVARARREHLTNVLFLNACPKSEISAWFAIADAGVASVRRGRSLATVLPNKVLDCLAAGKPLVAAIAGPVTEILERAEAGIAVPPSDPTALAAALRQLKSDPDQGRRMGEQGRLYVEAHFNRAAQVLALERVLLQVVARDRKAQATIRRRRRM